MGGSLNDQEVLQIRKIPRYHNLKYFVETGTYKADSTLLAAKYFDHVYTTEIHEGLYTEAKKRAEREGVTNITFLLGDSVKLLGDIAKITCESSCYFIDAHISGSESGWNGIQRVPIFEELNEILQYQHGPSVFIIDDARLWQSKVWDWQHVSDQGIVDLFNKKGYKVLSFYTKDDRFYIYI